MADSESNLETSAQRQRSVESAALAIVIERHSEPILREELLVEMKADVDDPARVIEVETAVEGLAAAGLVAVAHHHLLPTPAALRVAELDLGL